MDSSEREFVVAEIVNDIGWITIDRPKKLNSLSIKLMTELSDVLNDMADNDDIKVVVITGNEKSFSVGYDISEEVALGVSTAEQWHAGLTNNVGLTMQVWRFPKPVIGAVSGWALAGGCELAMACDILIASDEAHFGEPEIRFGSGPVTMLMPFIIGQKKTNELLLTGDTISAEEALELGMINKVVSRDELHAVVKQTAEKVAQTPLPILRFTKRALNRTYESMGLRDAVESNLDIAAVLNSAYSEERAEFTKLVSEEGLRSALAWRDKRYSKFE